MLHRFAQSFPWPWPRSLRGQLLMAIGLALLLAQGISAALLYRAQSDRREAALVHGAAMRLFAANHDERCLAPIRPAPLQQRASFGSNIWTLRQGSRAINAAPGQKPNYSKFWQGKG